jgi:hypothetical protein
MTLTSSDKSTIRLALIGWALRCDNEAELMEKRAVEMPERRENCLANAAASKAFAAAARALLDGEKLK